jgi:hypothetical protein
MNGRYKMLWIGITLTFALVGTALALIILQRRNVIIRLIVSAICGDFTIRFAAEPLTSYVGYPAYDEIAFTISMVLVSAVYFFFFTRHGFVLGWIFTNTVPLIQPIPQVSTVTNASTSSATGTDTTNGVKTVQFQTGRAKTVWEY